MATIIQVTKNSESMLINADHIETIKPLGEHRDRSRIEFASGRSSLDVDENMREVWTRIDKAHTKKRAA